jgi:hypothetical protein
MRCLARETQNRYQNVIELRADIDRVLEGTTPGRVTNVETVPVEKQDEATQFTPVPEPLLAQMRQAEWPVEPTTTEAPPAHLLAQSRRARRPSDEHTAFTPPPQQLLADMRRDTVEDHERPTQVARITDLVSSDSSVTPLSAVTPTSAITPLTAVTPTVPVPPRTVTPVRSATPHSVPIIGPLPTHNTPLPQIVAAPYAPPRPLMPANPPLPDWGAPAPGAAPPVATQPAMQPYPSVPPPLDPQRAPGFDMGRMAAREALVRKLIWAVSLLVAAGIGAILATQL